MNVLVTAGNTLVMIDRVRCLTNIFTGRTGAAIALAASARGHRVTLLTSVQEAMSESAVDSVWQEHGTTLRYRTFEDLQALLAETITSGRFDVVIHAAAVSDYQADGVFAPASGTRFVDEDRSWRNASGTPTLQGRDAGKIKSDEPELWLRLTRTPKLVDCFRTVWGFRGTLVKFKLEVGLSDAQLLEIAERSRRTSQADWMVANTLEGAGAWAFLGPFADGYRKIERPQLPARLLDAIGGTI